MKHWLLGKSVEQLTELAVSFGLRRFVGAQLADWLYKKRVSSLEMMTNVSAKIAAQIGDQFDVGGFAPTHVQESVDGTKKYLFPSIDGGDIEAVYIPDNERATLCISSQRGCRMGCKFCMTARMGFSHNLTSGEIVGQIVRLPEYENLTNVVLMGMGEPLDNWDNVRAALEVITAPWGLGWSPTRITLSTIGVLPALERFMVETKVHLAVSLHNPFDDQRAEMMPVQNKYSVSEIIEFLGHQDFAHQRRLSFEYIMFEGLNDSESHLHELVRLLRPLKCRVNLIRFHSIPDSPYRGSGDSVISFFNRSLNDSGVITTTRNSRGEDIFAACGMLATTTPM